MKPHVHTAKQRRGLFSYLEPYFLKHHPRVPVSRQQQNQDVTKLLRLLPPFRQETRAPEQVKTSRVSHRGTVCVFNVPKTTVSGPALFPSETLHKAYQTAHSCVKRTHPLFYDWRAAINTPATTATAATYSNTPPHSKYG